jgi:hypothetical protein
VQDERVLDREACAEFGIDVREERGRLVIETD